MEAISKEEQIKINNRNTTSPIKTTTTINFDNGVNVGIAAEKVEWDSSIALGEPTGTAKTKWDAQDERTLSGNNWDSKNISIVS